ncbi:MAG: TolC family protein [Vicinamibacterales bacterium]
MPSRAPLCAWFAACVVAVPFVALAQERSADEVVDAIVRDGPRAIAIRSDVDVVRRDQHARLAFPNPAVAYSREGAGFTEFFQVEQPLPLFGVRGVLARAGVAATAAAEAERDVRLWGLRGEASRLVTRWLWAQARVEATAADTQAVERLVGLLRVREREGEGSRFDRLRAEQEVADLRQAAVTAAIELSEARGDIAALLPPGVAVTRVTGVLTGTRTPPEREALVSRARASRAELRALQLGLDRTALEADAAKRSRWPVPVVSGGVKRADTGAETERGGVLGLNLSIPLFDTGAREAARWTAEGARIAAERTAIEQQVRAEVTRAAEALALRRQAIAEAGDDAVAAELVTTAEVAYREGDIGIVTLLDAVRTASRARMRDLDRRLDVRLAEIALERAVGERLWP